MFIKMITVLNDSRFKGKEQLTAIYYAINPLSVQHNFAFSHEEDMNEWVEEEEKLFAPEINFVEMGKLSDRTDINLLDVHVCGGTSKAVNQGKIL